MTLGAILQLCGIIFMVMAWRQVSPRVMDFHLRSPAFETGLLVFGVGAVVTILMALSEILRWLVWAALAIFGLAA